MARTVHLLPAGTGGVTQPGDCGAFWPSRSSSQALNCGGSNLMLPAPRYTNQENRNPVALVGTILVRAGIGEEGPGRTFGMPSSVATAVRVRG